MISVIIPVLNEAERLSRLLGALDAGGAESEIIVADGGSADGTVAVARERGARVVATARGLGQQIAAGAAMATGEIFLFLHADTRFPPGGLARIEAQLATRPEAVGGNFRLLFDGGTGFDAWLNGFYAWIRARGIYYGDSGIFVRNDVYRCIGGMRAMALMEDHEFVRRLERAGETLCIDTPPLVTSSRRFAGRSPIAIVLGWLGIHALFHMGVSPDHLARIYYRRRGPVRFTPPAPHRSGGGAPP
jgi:rSAM/selenodomain-associated transferase 2